MKYSSNARQVIDGLKARLEQLSGRKPSQYSVDKMVRTVALAVYASNLRRIHNQGKDINETSIGKYSTKPTLIGSSSFVNKTAAAKVFGKDKNRQLDWRTIASGGKQVRLAVLPGGYKKIREIEGRQTSHINLQRTGRLMKDYAVTNDGADWIIGFTSNYGKELREGQEEHFGKTIWGVSRNDAATIDKIINDFSQRALNA